MSGIVGDAAIPEDGIGPGSVETIAGAKQLYDGVVNLHAIAAASYVTASGVFTDELRASVGANGNINGGEFINSVDQRIVDQRPFLTESIYSYLHNLRIGAQQARSVLAKFQGSSFDVMISHLYTLEGIAMVWLSELFCSGVPMSEIAPTSGFILKPGSTTLEVSRRAIALFDSAITYSENFPEYSQFARVWKARVLLNLAMYDSAATVASQVQDNFRFNIEFLGRNVNNGFWMSGTSYGYNGGIAVSDREGVNGLPYISSADPRTEVAPGAVPKMPYQNFIVKKYPGGGYEPIVMADGVEARLIEAEAALQKGDTTGLIRMLNALRTSCTTRDDCDPNSSPGIGGVSGLELLDDPAISGLPTGKTAFEARTDLLFHERAYWLFLTGHRQSDLRRMIRQYDRPQETVYPIGAFAFTTPLGSVYGNHVVLLVPSSEQSRNPKYTGCIDRSA